MISLLYSLNSCYIWTICNIFRLTQNLVPNVSSTLAFTCQHPITGQSQNNCWSCHPQFTKPRFLNACILNSCWGWRACPELCSSTKRTTPFVCQEIWWGIIRGFFPPVTLPGWASIGRCGGLKIVDWYWVLTGGKKAVSIDDQSGGGEHQCRPGRQAVGEEWYAWELGWPGPQGKGAAQLHP